jgi:hypothetical protein
MFAVLDEPAASISVKKAAITVSAYCTHTQINTGDKRRLMVSIKGKVFREIGLMAEGDRLAKTMEVATPMLQRAMEKQLKKSPLNLSSDEAAMGTEDSSQRAKRARTGTDRWCPSSFPTPPSKEVSPPCRATANTPQTTIKMFCNFNCHVPCAVLLHYFQI